MSPTNHKVLIAEDDKFLSRALVDTLKRSKLEVIAASNGVEVLEKAKAETPDIILLDLLMPEKDGFETLEELKLDKDLKNIPVIILSNLSQEIDQQKTKELGAVEYFVKSNIKIHDVVEKVKFHLAKKKSA